MLGFARVAVVKKANPCDGVVKPLATVPFAITPKGEEVGFPAPPQLNTKLPKSWDLLAGTPPTGTLSKSTDSRTGVRYWETLPALSINAAHELVIAALVLVVTSTEPASICACVNCASKRSLPTTTSTVSPAC